MSHVQLDHMTQPYEHGLFPLLVNKANFGLSQNWLPPVSYA